ncbi:hypothetical protein GGU10DRAFT_417947 [Lentinula aff. detonsa]|uniref:Uncharacterized protein n=1 Tax=Lentinula aff. detonsa TaxID=2804958 RepID=A0AA38U1W7_9AGAR|nr:hypothetical protein GGU10DRAFT_417947 [Lentinula aff. detonsa]
MKQCWFFPPIFRAVCRRRRYCSQTSKRNYTTATFPTSFTLDREILTPISPAHSNLKFLLASAKPSPNDIWTSYNDALDGGGLYELDLPIHQKVLRRCTLSMEQMRKNSRRHYLSIARPAPGHVHEHRFQNVIRNILSLGYTPSRNDYHFILGHFAAVGHSIGSIGVYNEMNGHGDCLPDSVTIALVLQSIAHRLGLPERKADRQETVNYARRQLKQILDDMRRRGISWTSINMDLTIRIMKHTSDEENFDTLLKLGYGIDIRYPDRPIVDNDSSVLLPFTLHTLNTVINMYGLGGNISKLVQAFEVLTVPLPHAQKHFSASFEDEDDFGVTPPDSSTSLKLPSAEPNTTTYTFLLRHVSQHNKAHLARHYLLQAIKLDIEVSRYLRCKIIVTPNLEDVQAPRMAVNRAMLAPVFGLSNRNKNVALMRWLYSRIPSIIRRKKADVLHFSNFIKHLEMVGKWPPPPKPKLFSPTDKTRASTSKEYVDVDGVRWRRADVVDVLAIDPNHQQPMPVYSPKPIDLRLHLRILKTDINELTVYHGYIRSVLARTIERVKDKIGRRIWKERDIYLKDAVIAGRSKMRSKISKEMWRQIVNYKPKLMAGFARPPSHFHHQVIRHQYWREVKSARKEKVKEGTSAGVSMPGRTSMLKPNLSSTEESPEYHSS